MKSNLNSSPCLTCTSVRDPGNCENKNCARWRSWFIGKWEHIRQFPRMQMETASPNMGSVNIGGMPYVLPHRVRDYLQKDPCSQCACPKNLCGTPCPTRKAWDSMKSEVVQ